MSGLWRSPVTLRLRRLRWIWVRKRIAKTAENFGYGQDLKIPLTVSKSSFPSNLTQSQLAQSADWPVRREDHSAAGGDDFCGDRERRRADEAEPDSFGEDQQPERTLQEFSPEKLRTSTSPESCQPGEAVDGELRLIMVLHVMLVSPVYKVAGKTGTAETTAGLNNSWFTGFRAGR